MAVNAIFKTNNLASIQAERNLYSDLIKEAIQIYGHDVYYIDRTLVARDDVLGEDSVAPSFTFKFNSTKFKDDKERTDLDGFNKTKSERDTARRGVT